MKIFFHNICIPFFILTFISSVIYGQTNVSGGIYTNTTWTLANSPYVVTDTVIVYPQVTLTIQPGVVVRFDNYKQIEIRQGALIATGSNTDSIIFTSNASSPSPGIYSGIYFNGGGHLTSKFSYCNFQFAEDGIRRCEQYLFYDTLTIKNCSFKNNMNGINSVLGYVTIDSSVFRNNSNYGIYNLYNGYISNCEINFNQFGLYKNYSVLMNHCKIKNNHFGLKNTYSSSISNCIIDSNFIGVDSIAGGSGLHFCEVKYNQYGVLDSANQFEVKNSTIDSNYFVGIQMQRNLWPTIATVTNCLIRYNGTGISDSGSVGQNIITRNIIENNSIGIELGSNNDQINCNRICNNIFYDLKFITTGNADISHNYWCTSDSASTAVNIFDGNDTTNSGLVNFMPLDTVQCYLCNPFDIYIYPTAAIGFSRTCLGRDRGAG